MEPTHGRSIYAEDPNGNTVEWSYRDAVLGRGAGRCACERLQQSDLPCDVAHELEFFLAADHEVVTSTIL